MVVIALFVCLFIIPYIVLEYKKKNLFLFETNMNESNDSKTDVDSVNILTNSVKSKIVRVLC